VIPYYHRFLAALPTVAALAAAPEGQLLKLWEGLGYYSRVRNMQKAAKAVMSEHGGVFPQTYAEIRALCGVGDYTAGAIGSFAFDLAVPAVDGNVLRVAARLAAYGEDILSTTAKRVLTAAVAAVQPAAHAADFNQAMIELGATVCLPNGVPKCDLCPLRDRCEAHRCGLETALPVRRAAAPRKIQEKTVIILRAGDRVALRRRPDTGLLAGLFEPPCLAGKLSAQEMQARLAAWGIVPLYLTPLEESKHVFTHVEWHMVGFEVILPTEFDLSALQIPQNGAENCDSPLFFAPREEIDEKYALPTAYRAYRPYM
jgi:A/G-specific adenine glycosylase